MANIELTLTPASPTGSMIFTLGAPGPQGPAGTIEVGTVSASAPGGPADVVNVGTNTAAILDFTIPRGEQGTQGIQGIQGIQGVPGQKGDKGDQGDPGEGVPVGGSTGQVLAKVDGVDYNTEWINVDPSTSWGEITGTLSDQTDLQSALNLKANLASPVFTGDPRSVTPSLGDNDTSIATTAWVRGQNYAPISSLQNYAPLFDPVLTGNPRSVTPATADNDTSIATTAFVKAQGYITSAPVTSVAGRTGAITLSVADVSGSAPIASPIFTGDPRGVTRPANDISVSLATTAFVIGQAATATPLVNGTGAVGVSRLYARQDHIHPSDTSRLAVTSNLGDVQNASTARSNLGLGTMAIASDAPNDSFIYGRSENGWTKVLGLGGGLMNQDSGITWNETSSAIPTYTAISGSQFFIIATQTNQYVQIQPTQILVTSGSGAGSQNVRIGWEGITAYDGINTYSYITSNGGTFSNKVNFTSVAGSAGLNIGIGGVQTTATTPGDLWIQTGGAILNYRDGTGAWRQVLTTNNAGSITVNSSTTPALRLTQQGTAPTFVVEDSATPDTSSLVVDASGNVGIGVAAGYTSTSKVEVVGNVKADTFSNGAGPAFSVNSVTTHTGGSNSNDIIVTIGGVNYRISARVV